MLRVARFTKDEVPRPHLVSMSPRCCKKQDLYSFEEFPVDSDGCVCVCVREREREGERAGLFIYLLVRILLVNSASRTIVRALLKQYRTTLHYQTFVNKVSLVISRRFPLLHSSARPLCPQF